MSAGAAVLDGSPPPLFTPEQLDDFATLFARELPRANLVWLATEMKVPLADAANEAGDLAFALAVVHALAGAGKLSDAIALLRHGTKASFLTLGMGDIIAGRRLDSADHYQALVNRYQPFLSSEAFMEAFPRVARTVCAIGIGMPVSGVVPGIVGTGFLVGPDLVLTNAHVIRPLLNMQSDPPEENGSGDDIVCFFDYVADPTPRVPPADEPQRIFTAVKALPQRWLRAARAPLPYDGTANCPADAQKMHDYALIQLQQKIGLLPSRRSGGVPRGWMAIPDAILVDVRDQRIIVHQHPGGAPLQFDIGDYMGLDPTGTRVRYQVSTADGSSGGVAVDAEGQLFALHNAEVVDSTPVQNQGVRIDKIAEDLAERLPNWNVFPPLDQQPFWSLSEERDDPRPIIGRDELRQNVLAMRAEGAPRVMAVWGPSGCGLRYSVKLLRRTLESAASARVVEYSADNLMTFTPERFAQKLISGINLTGFADDPMPRPNATENLPRWLRLDLPSWIARRLAQFAAQNAAAVPVWLVLNTAVEDFIWADNLSDFVAALAGVHDPGQGLIEQPHLRLLFLSSGSPSLLPIGGVPRFEDDLTRYTTHEADFEQCVRRAYYALDKTMNLGDSAFLRNLARVTILGRDTMTYRKTLSEFIRGLVLTR